MKRIFALLIAAAMLLSLSACSDGRNAALYFPISGTPSTVDPQFTQSHTADLIINNVFEGLVRYNEEGEIGPGVAESWDVSSDGTVYTFHLRPDAVWKPVKKVNTAVLGEDYGKDFEDFPTAVTAADFVFAFRRAVDPATMCPHANEFFIIKNAEAIYNGDAAKEDLGVRAADEHTLVIELNGPAVDLLDRLTHSAFMPCNELYFTLTGGRYGLTSTYLLGNGPFYVGAWEDNKTVTLSRNNDYHGDSPVNPASVTLSVSRDVAAIADKLSLGTYCGYAFTNADDAPEENVTALPVEDTVYGFCFNCKDEIMMNENIRLAFCSCIKRMDYELPPSMTAFCKSIVPGCCTVGSLNYADTVYSQLNTVSLSTGNALLFWDAGLKELEKTKLNLTLLCEERFAPAMRKQLQMWQQTLGVNLAVTVQTMDNASLEQALAKGEYQFAFAPIHADYTSTASYLESFCTNAGGNVFGHTATEYDAIVAEIMKASNQQDSLNACFTADTYLSSHGIYYPLFCSSTVFAVSDEISGLVFSASGDTVSFQWVVTND